MWSLLTPIYSNQRVWVVKSLVIWESFNPRAAFIPVGTPVGVLKWRRSRVKYIPKRHMILFVWTHSVCLLWHSAHANSFLMTQDLHLKKQDVFGLFLLNFTWTSPFVSRFGTLMWVWMFVSEHAYIFHGLRIFFMLHSSKSETMFWIVPLWCSMRLHVDLRGQTERFRNFISQIRRKREGEGGSFKTRKVIGWSARLPQRTNQIFFSLFFLDCIFFFTAWSFLFVWSVTVDMHHFHMLLWNLSWCQNKLAKPSQE